MLLQETAESRPGQSREMPKKETWWGGEEIREQVAGGRCKTSCKTTLRFRVVAQLEKHIPSFAGRSRGRGSGVSSQACYTNINSYTCSLVYIRWLPGEVKAWQELGFGMVLAQLVLLCCPTASIPSAAGCRARWGHWCGVPPLVLRSISSCCWMCTGALSSWVNMWQQMRFMHFVSHAKLLPGVDLFNVKKNCLTDNSTYSFGL